MAQIGPGQVERRPPVPIFPGAPFQFACRGCGSFCCTNEHLVVSPLELRELVQALGIDAADLSARGWLVAYPDPESGVPRVAIEFLPVQPALTVCPFLGPADGETATAGGDPSPLARLDAAQAGARQALRDGDGRPLSLRCQAYHGRPIMCRSFPLQFKLQLRSDGAAAGWTMLAHTRCPGHGYGPATQTADEYLAASGIASLAAARVAWHELNLAIAGAGVVLGDPAVASRSRRALWDTTLNLLFASYARPRLQVTATVYVPTILALFRQYLAPVASGVDAERRAAAGVITRSDATRQIRSLVTACQALETALDEPVVDPVSLSWPSPPSSTRPKRAEQPLSSPGQ